MYTHLSPTLYIFIYFLTCVEGERSRRQAAGTLFMCSPPAEHFITPTERRPHKYLVVGGGLHLYFSAIILCVRISRAAYEPRNISRLIWTTFKLVVTYRGGLIYRVLADAVVCRLRGFLWPIVGVFDIFDGLIIGFESIRVFFVNWVINLSY